MQRDALLVAEMIDAAEAIQTLIGDVGVEALAADRQRRDAVLWNFTVLGEAAVQVSPETKARFPEIQWLQPSRLRNRIVHGYWSIDIAILHTTAADSLPTFVEQLRAALSALESHQAPESG